MFIGLKDEIVVICGPMYSGKSNFLILSLDKLKYSKTPFIVFKPSMDRFSGVVCTRYSNLTEKAIPIDVDSPGDILNHVDLSSIELPFIVAIDEAQFFSNGLVDVVKELHRKGVRVWISGLDMDAWGNPFGPMPQLLSLSTKVIKMTSVCDLCAEEASRTGTRLARPNTNIVVDECPFFPVCTSCFNKIVSK